MPSEKMASEADWDSHKRTMGHLYLSENKPLKLVMDIMANSYCFVASKSQYERQMRKWQFRKNLKNQEWRTVQLHLSKRKRDGKESDLYIDGILVPRKKLQKELSRNRFAPFADPCAHAPSPEIPNGVCIMTPAASEPNLLKTDNLPWSRFVGFLESQELLVIQSCLANPFIVDNHEASMVAVYSRQAVSCTTFFQQSSTLPEEIHFGIMTWMFNLERENHTASIQAIQSKLLSTMPEIHIGEHRASATRLVGPVDRGTVWHVMKPVLYMLSNNLAMPSLGVEDRIIKWLHLEEDLCNLKNLISIPGPTTEALAESIFRSAVQVGDVKMVKTLIDWGLSPDRQVINRCSRLYTPLQYAIFKENIELTRILIEAGVDLNASAECPLGETPLQLAARTRKPELVKILLANGARVEITGKHGPSVLHNAIHSGGIESVQLLLSAGADIENKDEEGLTPLHSAVSYNEVEIAKTLIRAGANVNTTSNRNETNLEMAAQDGSMEMVKALLGASGRLFGSSLALAVKEGEDDMELVQILLDAGASIDEWSSGGRTALTEAALNNNIELVQFLIGAGANIDGCALEERDERLMTPLQAASYHKTVDLAQILLRAGASVDVCAHGSNIDGDFEGTALQIAASCGNVKLVKILLEAGADVNAAASVHGRTAFQAAIQTKNTTLIQTLLDAGAYINAPAAMYGGRTVLQAAVEAGDRSIINRVLEEGADIDALAAEGNGITALTAAIRNSDTELVYTLLDAGADVNNPSARLWGESALEAAAASSDLQLVRYLLSIGAEPNDSCALQVAVENRDIELAQTLLAAETFFDRPRGKYGSVALQTAVRLGDIGQTRMLLAAGIDLNAPTSPLYGRSRNHQFDMPFIRHGVTVLEVAIEEGDHSMVQFLLEAGADPNVSTARRSAGYNPALWEAVYRPNSSITHTLLEAGADVKACRKASSGCNALQLAAGKGEIELVQMLLKAGADVNAPPADIGGVTALQAAAIGGYFGITRILVEANADVNAAPAREQGRTALEGAAEHGRIDMLQLLLNSGASVEEAGRAQYDRALQLAAKNGHNAACRLLRAYHAGCYGSS